MAGHNKWSKIKHRKAVVDKRRSKVWSSVARDIILAARTGGGDPHKNLKLSWAVAEAKKANMPADTIERAIKRGTGELEGVDPEEIIYEGYGAGGSALLVVCLTDNRNRTAGNVRHIFEKKGGKLGTSGSVAYLFNLRGKVVVPKSAITEEKLMDLVLDAGAEDIDSTDDHAFEVFCDQTALEDVKAVLRDKGVHWDSAERAYIPTMTTMLDAESARKVMTLVETLEDDDDVQSVVGNFEIPDDVLAELGQ